MSAYQNAMQRYFDFNGRATRAQFWYFVLFVTLFMFAAIILDVAVGNDEEGALLFTALVIIAHIIPYLAIGARRLHDTDKSGWWQLMSVVPLGQIILLVFFCLESKPDGNRFGPGANDPITEGATDTSQVITQSLDHIERLSALRESGAINDDEFQNMKSSAIDKSN